MLIGWLGARWMPVRHAAWSLPVGVGIAMTVWLPVRRPAGLSLVVATAVIVAWVCALTVVSILSQALAPGRPAGAALFAAAGGVVLIALAPLLAAMLGVGPAVATPESLGTWIPTVLSDRYYLLATQNRQASEIASMVAVLIMTGTCYVLAYVIRLGSARGASELDSSATTPQTAL